MVGLPSASIWIVVYPLGKLHGKTKSLLLNVAIEIHSYVSLMKGNSAMMNQ